MTTAAVAFALQLPVRAGACPVCGAAQADLSVYLPPTVALLALPPLLVGLFVLWLRRSRPGTERGVGRAAPGSDAGASSDAPFGPETRSR
ncbi:MAG: hypothetical protein NZ898_13210 [Myxococcota bacterium]|nr:hypothetical protein [Myxococcota bacterium]MDW8363726.1 hypothetical protein [Myxococcales bacterium]